MPPRIVIRRASRAARSFDPPDEVATWLRASITTEGATVVAGPGAPATCDDASGAAVVGVAAFGADAGLAAVETLAAGVVALDRAAVVVGVAARAAVVGVA